jgi:hypothetical protein
MQFLKSGRRSDATSEIEAMPTASALLVKSGEIDMQRAARNGSDPSTFPAVTSISPGFCNPKPMVTELCVVGDTAEPHVCLGGHEVEEPPC